MYQVGFGDCFLVSFSYRRPLADGRDERHMLVDFGSTHAPRGRRHLLPGAAQLIEEHTNGQLDVLVATTDTKTTSTASASPRRRP